MDLNERDFAPTSEHTLASFARDERADVLVVAMSWLDSSEPIEEEQEAAEAEKDEWEDVRDVISYWVVRCMPLLGSGAALIAANRVGREGGASSSSFLARSDALSLTRLLSQIPSSPARRALSSSATDQPSRSTPISAARPSSSPRSRFPSEPRSRL